MACRADMELLGLRVRSSAVAVGAFLWKGGGPKFWRCRRQWLFMFPRGFNA
jgi:hypothetical protein